jgi:hypothetical protein
MMFANLKLYKDRYGNCDVPGSHENDKLAMWVNNQRHLARSGRLSSERRARLEELGFEWEHRESNWETMCAELERFKLRYGHCNIPHGGAENVRLDGWVKSQRASKHAGKLSPKREARLDALGFDWAPKLGPKFQVSPPRTKPRPKVSRQRPSPRRTAH